MNELEKMKYIEVDTMKFEDGRFHVSLCFSLIEASSEVNLLMTRDEFIGFRNAIHNLLIDLNTELNNE